MGTAGKDRFALAHNGVIYNDVWLRKDLKLPKTKIETDSYIAVQLIEDKNNLSFSTLGYMAEKVHGTFSFTVLDEGNNLYFVKGDNPLCIYRYPKSGVIIYASTETILKKALAKLKLFKEPHREESIFCGDILRIDPYGSTTASVFDTNSLYSNIRLPIAYTPWQYDRSSHISGLKSMAGIFGYTPDDVDFMLGQGITPDELEEYFYCGEL